MTTMTHDAGRAGRSEAAGSRFAGGVGFAVVSAASFGLAGAVGRGPLDAGWSPVAVVMVRVAVAAVVLLPLGLLQMRGRWGLLRRHAALVVAYGLFAVAGAQFCYFAAVERMQVAPALMIEYLAPAVVVAWLWLRHGQRPGRVTLAGAAVAAIGLLLVLDLVAGAGLDPVGVLWALGATVGLSVYFVVSADESNGLPPLALAAGGLLVGTVVLSLLAVAGLLPVAASTEPAAYAGGSVAWWVPLLVLGLVTAALAYGTGIAASRRLGSRVASFVALLEVVAAVVFAWVLLDELPSAGQLVGGALILAGVVLVKRGERAVVRPEPVPA